MLDGIFDTLYQYSCEMSGKTTGVTKERFVCHGQSIWKGKEYISKRQDNSVYLGWVPLKGDNATKYEVLRNDNDVVIGNKIGKMDPSDIPLYFISFSVSSEKKTIQLERIFLNPSLEIDISPCLLKRDLECLANDSNVSIDFSYLKFYDSGRWYLEFLYGDD
jgi:hypothetical protein